MSYVFASHIMHAHNYLDWEANEQRLSKFFSLVPIIHLSCKLALENTQCNQIYCWFKRERLRNLFCLVSNIHLLRGPSLGNTQCYQIYWRITTPSKFGAFLVWLFRYSKTLSLLVTSIAIQCSIRVALVFLSSLSIITRLATMVLKQYCPPLNSMEVHPSQSWIIKYVIAIDCIYMQSQFYSQVQKNC